MRQNDRDANDGKGRQRVAIIGNSNSVMIGSYARILAGCNHFIVINKSIGATPNLILLSFLADEPTPDYDFIIVETAVVDSLQADSLYSRERSKDTLEIFLRHVRHNSDAIVIFLCIPTRPSILTPARHWQERLYREIAAQYHIPILDGFALVRQLIGPKKINAIGSSYAAAEKLAASFGLPLHLRDSIAWRGLRDQQNAWNALGVYGFNDNAHFSPALHFLVADLLGKFIDEQSSSRPAATGGAQHRGSPVVVLASHPPGADTVLRESSLISRQLVRVTNANPIRYHCPEGFRVYGLLLNQAATSCILRLRSRIGDTAFDLRFNPRNSDWIAVIVPILDAVGGGDIDLTIDSAPQPAERLRLGVGIDNLCSEPLAEIGEMILVSEDWASILAAPIEAAGSPMTINDQPWANALIAEAARGMNAAVVGIEADGCFVDRGSFRFVSEVIAGKSGVLSPTDRARLLLVMGAERELADFLEAAPEGDLEHTELIASRETFRTIQKEANIPSQDHFDRIRTLIKASEYEEATRLLDAACARFPSDIRFFGERAWIPFRQKNIPGAIEQWSSVTSLFPESPVGYLGLAACLRVDGQLQEAESLLARTMSLFPNEAFAAAQHALLAVERNDLPEALQRLQSTRDRFPAYTQNRMALTRLAIRIGDSSIARDEIDALVAAGQTTDELVVLAVEASVKGAGCDWLEQIWTHLTANISQNAKLSSSIRSALALDQPFPMPRFLSLWLATTDKV